MAKNATFKHIDFDSSPIMRSLERLTLEKERLSGSSENLIVKQAQASISKTADVAPTSNLMENVLKLCARLSEQGLVKQAQEIETNFLLYKREAAANNLYDVSKETGEDLVDAAHPDGSHHMEDVDADEALFETILDKHKKIVEKIEKQPTGKLANQRANQRAIQSVKKIFANESEDLEQNIVRNVDQVLQILNRVIPIVEPELTISTKSFTIAIEELSHDPKIGNLRLMAKTLDDLIYRLRPGTIIKGVSEQTWQRYSGLLTKAQQLLKQAIDFRTRSNELYSANEISDFEPKPSVSVPKVVIPAKDPLTVRLESQLNKLKAVQFVSAVANNQGVSNWIRNEMKKITTSIDGQNARTDEQKKEIEPILQREVEQYEAEVANLYQQLNSPPNQR